jgi:hypothetical protein
LRLLVQLNPSSSKIPRTYIVLRIAEQLDLISTFIDGGFSDHWFAATEQQLPHSMRASQRRRFMDTQQLVMTESMDLEQGNRGQHCHFQQGEPVPLEPKGILGTGGFG